MCRRELIASPRRHFLPCFLPSFIRPLGTSLSATPGEKKRGDNKRAWPGGEQRGDLGSFCSVVPWT